MKKHTIISHLLILSQALLQTANSQNYAEVNVGTHHKISSCKHGAFLINSKDTYISKSLDLYGEWFDGEMDLFQRIIKPGDVVVDVGANLGAFTIPFAKSVGGEGFVYAFETQRVLSQLLAANVALNELTNVKIVNAAVGADSSLNVNVPHVRYDIDANFGGLSLLEDWKALGAKTEIVPQVTLDEQVFSVGSRCPSFIKIDVEGMEHHVLSGSRRILSECQSLLYLENNCVKGSEELLRYISEFGYTCHWDVQPHFRLNNYKNNQENIFDTNEQQAYSINMLCFHENSTDMVQTLGLNDVTRIDVKNGKFELQDNNLSFVGREDEVLRQLGTKESCQR